MWIAGIGAAAVLLLGAAVVTLGLWGSRGGLAAFLRGQRDPAVELRADAPVREPVESEAPAAVSVRVEIDTDAPVHRVSAEYLSVAIDSSQVTGGRWWDPEARGVETGTGTVESPVFDFDRPRLDALVEPLSPMWLRIGGSEADKIYYDLDNPARASEQPPPGFESVLTRGQWDALNAFADRNGLRVIFTLNAGPSVRDGRRGPWSPDNARELIRYTAQRGYPVELWELGNEVNNFWYVFGPRRQVSARRYAADARAAIRLIDAEHPGAAFAGQGGMIWPVLGEPLGLFFGISHRAVELIGSDLAVVSWHYYPQQGRRGPIASRSAHPARLLNPDNLDEAAYWGARFRRSRDRHAPDAELWVGETGNAQFGGEPGLSDVYLGGLWWLDQLGLLARNGHDVVVRQSLSGQDYGLLEAGSLEPRPDYWNSLAWKELMGREVFEARSVAREGTSAEAAEKVRVYAHGAGPGYARSPSPADAADAGRRAVTLLAINLHHDRAARLAVPQLDPGTGRLYQFDATDIFARVVRLNDTPLGLGPDGAPPRLSDMGRAPAGTDLVLPPLTYAFVVGHAGQGDGDG